MEDAGIVLKKSATLTFTMTYKVFMVMVQLYIGIILSPPPPIIQVSLVDHWVFLFMVTRSVYLGLIPANFLHITMLEYTFSNQGYPMKL